LGLEPTVQQYVLNITQVMREVRRVLKETGTCWLNLGDCYSGRRIKTAAGDLKPKDLAGVPWAVAFALRNDGWWLRSDIIWSKINPMPETATDRPTKTHEYIFLLSKSKRYFYDMDAIRTTPREATDADADMLRRGLPAPLGRNRWTVWSAPTQTYSSGHVAPFPEAIVEPCIKAGSSERGVCIKCGSPWERVTDKVGMRVAGSDNPDNKRANIPGVETSPTSMFRTGKLPILTSAGWQPTCTCYATPMLPKYPRPIKDASAETIESIRQERQRLLDKWAMFKTAPAIILDPFVGTGTTCVVARRLSRDSIGLDISQSYLLKEARRRLELDRLDAWLTGAKVKPISLRGLPLSANAKV
jgi:DNA modification methylase